MLEKLLEIILKSTIDSTLVWKLEPSIFNCSLSQLYSTVTNDGSKIEVTIILENDFKYGYFSGFTIKNSNFVDGRKIFTETRTPIIEAISKEVYKRYIVPTIKPRSKSDDDIYLDIMNAIPDKQESRDSKIDDIIGNQTKKKWKLF